MINPVLTNSSPMSIDDDDDAISYRSKSFQVKSSLKELLNK